MSDLFAAWAESPWPKTANTQSCGLATEMWRVRVKNETDGIVTRLQFTSRLHPSIAAPVCWVITTYKSALQDQRVASKYKKCYLNSTEVSVHFTNVVLESFFSLDPDAGPLSLGLGFGSVVLPTNNTLYAFRANNFDQR